MGITELGQDFLFGVVKYSVLNLYQASELASVSFCKIRECLICSVSFSVY